MLRHRYTDFSREQEPRPRRKNGEPFRFIHALTLSGEKKGLPNLFGQPTLLLNVSPYLVSMAVSPVTEESSPFVALSWIASLAK